jgi:hypothetical protein
VNFSGWALSALVAGAGAEPRAREFVEVSRVLPATDITHAMFGASAREIWVGTAQGRVYRTRDLGESYELVFEVPDAEPLVVPQLETLRAVSLGDLGRGLERDVDPRDRTGRTGRQADLAGNVRDRPRERGAPLLASLVRPGSREPTTIEQLKRCGDAVFVLSGSGLFRSTDDGARFDRLSLGPTKKVQWVSCDSSRPGRVLLDIGHLALESHDLGETFYPFFTPLPQADDLGFDLDDEGRAIVFDGRKTFREDAARRRFELVCELRPDSLGAAQVAWTWMLPTERVLAVTHDGVQTCHGNDAGRLPDLRLAERIRYLWADGLDHLYVATSRNVFESFDGGATLREIFTAPAQRSITRVIQRGSDPNELLIATGGQIFLPAAVAPPRHDVTAEVSDRLMRDVPLHDVVSSALGRLHLAADDLAGKRTDLRLRSLMPTVVARYAYCDCSSGNSLTDVGVLNPRELTGSTEASQRQWAVFALWDLRDFLFDPLQIDTTWADLEVLRREITYRVQDTYTRWVQTSGLLADPALPARLRAHHLLTQRAAAAYLDSMTGGAFAAFTRETS